MHRKFTGKGLGETKELKYSGFGKRINRRIYPGDEIQGGGKRSRGSN